ncbi:calcitonin gene-related peptide type 1 receptor isoform X1 [Cloeon dipterum]|uniref:calcitonin gene-related peptide type 1 receptor isoform X1 n=1 Tax=Cloeon dipterum TaxID=197152 RepID=UPI00321F8ECE
MALIVEERAKQCATEHLGIVKNSSEAASVRAGDNEEGLFCPQVFDGWSCWARTPAGSVAELACPDFITGFDPSRIAHRVCNSNGSWFIHPDSGKPWSNYTTCINLEDLEWRRQVTKIYETGYAVSLAAIIASLFIFIYFKSLRCTRIMLHINLFVSFATNNALWILWYRLVVEQPSVLSDNEVGCALLHVSLHYFLLSNYFWMFCEGFYLHILLVATFTSEDKLKKWLYLCGWGLPAIVVVLYTILRLTDNDPQETSECWIHESKFNWVLVVPVCLSLAASFTFLCNIVRVLIVKLRAGPHVGSGPSPSALQAVRATLLLLPLLGLHYLITPFRPESASHPLLKTYEALSAIFTSFQGLCVAFLFCFCNGEVITQIKRKWNLHMAQFRPRASSFTAATTVTFIRSTAAPLPGEEKV